MIQVELKLKSGSLVTLFLTTNFAVYKGSVDTECSLKDGVHNNGGWDIAESYKSVLKKIANAQK